MTKAMQVVILCGGKGTRMGHHTRFLPKPLIKIGQRPILWHIMKIYSFYGFNRFVLCLGYKKQNIEEYFSHTRGWHITFVDTGLSTNTGGRIKRIEKYIETDNFLATYGDGVADVNINRLIQFHNKNKKIATLTAVKPRSQFGIMDIEPDNRVKDFHEKPVLTHWVNGGFFVFNRRIFKYLGKDDILERKPFYQLSKDKELVAYKHHGFWECMDTYKDNLELNQAWKSAAAPWALWS